jgi:hypothetical protein
MAKYGALMKPVGEMALIQIAPFNGKTIRQGTFLNDVSVYAKMAKLMADLIPPLKKLGGITTDTAQIQALGSTLYNGQRNFIIQIYMKIRFGSDGGNPVDMYWGGYNLIDSKTGMVSKANLKGLINMSGQRFSEQTERKCQLFRDGVKLADYYGSDRQEKTPESNMSRPATNKSLALEQAKEKCTDIGFTKGTEKFGDCVLKLID